MHGKQSRPRHISGSACLSALATVFHLSEKNAPFFSSHRCRHISVFQGLSRSWFALVRVQVSMCTISVCVGGVEGWAGGGSEWPFSTLSPFSTPHTRSGKL